MSAESEAESDPVLEALQLVTADLEKNIEASRIAIERADEIRNLRSRGLGYAQILDELGRPLVVELITENLDRLRDSGATLRQSQASALHAEGLTMERIADLFGVSRQRISTLLKAAHQGEEA